MTTVTARIRSGSGLPGHQRGFSLLEILIAIVVLAIGLLGLAGLQTTSLQQNQSAAQVSQATFLAQDIMDRMRANSDAAKNGDYDIDFGQLSVSRGGLAGDDVGGWLGQLQTALPGVASDECDGDDCGAQIRVNGDGRAEVIIQWIDERRPEDDDQRMTRFSTVSRI